MAVTLFNTSALTTQRLTAWGFGIDPNATSVSFGDAQGADGGMVNASLSAIPSLSLIEVCAFGGVNCPGGANGGILGGANDSFSLTLTGTWGASVGLDPIGVKYQTAGDRRNSISPPGTPVPEPVP